MNVQARPYQPAFEGEWEQFVADCSNATLLHRRLFLGYHGDRFLDCSLLLSIDGRLAAVLPAAQSPADPREVVSHPGATYGGLLHSARVRGEALIWLLEAVLAHYRKAGYQRLVYKPVPHIYPTRPAQDDVYALFRLGAVRTRCDLSCAVDLAQPRVVSQRRRRSLAKARNAVTLEGGTHLLPQAWAVLKDNLERKHGAAPVHSLPEIGLLARRFPHEIQLRCALVHGQVAAAVLLFNSTRVWHAQYIASSAIGYEVNALDALFDALIAEAAAAGAQYFDFGTSNEQGGRVLNAGLYEFKTEFGGGGVAYEHYAI